MKTSQAGLDLIKKCEGVRHEAYPDPATGGDPWTIGVGHTRGVKKGDTATDEQVDQYLADDLHEAETAVNNGVRVPITQAQFDAMVSFTFNVGGGAFSNSTLLRKANALDFDGAADEFLRWNKAGGAVMAGLTKRRVCERMLFLTGAA